MSRDGIEKDISIQRKIVSCAMSITGVARLFHKRKLPSEPGKILIIQWGYLGDLVLSTPALHLLRNAYPLSEITLVTSPENEGYINKFPFVNRIIYIRNPLSLGRTKFSVGRIMACIKLLHKNRYDLAIELSGRLTSQVFLPFLKTNFVTGQDPTNNFYFLDKRINSKGKHQIERDMDVVRLAVPPVVNAHKPSLWNPATDDDRVKIKELLRSNGIREDNYVVAHPFGSWGPKQWPIERWIEVFNFILNKDKAVIFVGAGKDSARIEDILSRLNGRNSFNFSGLINIPEAVALMERAKLFVGSDSGPMHLAAIANLKGVVIFGPGDIIKWKHDIHEAVYKEPECGPCPQAAFKKTCDKGLSICKGLLDIYPDEVIEACKKYL